MIHKALSKKYIRVLFFSALGGWLYCWFVVLPCVSGIRASCIALARETDKIHNVWQMLARAESLPSRVRIVAGDQRRAGSEDTLSVFLDDIAQSLSAHDLVLTHMRPERSSSRAAKKMSISVEAKGAFKNVYAFIASMAQMDRPTGVKKIVIQTRQDAEHLRVLLVIDRPEDLS